MTTHDPDWKFRNRVRKMIADKIGSDANGSSKNRKNLVTNSQTKMQEPVFKIEREIALSDNEFDNFIASGNEEEEEEEEEDEDEEEEGEEEEEEEEEEDDEEESKEDEEEEEEEDSVRPQQKLKLKRSIKEMNEDSNEDTEKKNSKEKKRRTDGGSKNCGEFSTPGSSKEKFNIIKKQSIRKKSEGTEIFIVNSRNEGVKYSEENLDGDVNDDYSPLFGKNDFCRNEIASFLGSRKKFGEPKTIITNERIVSEKKFGEPLVIKGTPKAVSASSIFESAVPNLKRPSRIFNSQGNILSNFISDIDDVNFNWNPVFYQGVKMAEESSDDDEKLGDDLEDSVYDSNVSFTPNDEKFDSNSSPYQTNDSTEQPGLCEDSTVSESDGTNKPRFYSLQNRVIAMMSPGCKFYFNGKLRVKVLIGKVEIYGSIFGRLETSTPAEVYSPRGSSLVSIETVVESDAETDHESLSTLLINEGINNDTAMDLENKLRELPEGQAVVVLENLENTLTKFLDIYFQYKLFPKNEDPSNYHNCHPKKAQKLLNAVFQYEDFGKQMQKDEYRESRILNRFLNRGTDESRRILIAGGKSVGKSTTLRHFVNSLLPIHKEIVVVDFDPGQPEFTPPGCISLNIVDRVLTGPNYTHLRTPFYQIFIGDVNVARCVPRYVKAARKLVDHLNESPRLRGRLVIVNTMGFCTGIGRDLMVYIIKLIHPSTVIQINSERLKNNFSFSLSSETINNQSPTHFTGGEEEKSVWEVPCDHELDVVPSLAEAKGKSGDFWELEPRHQRELTLLAYLSKILKDDEEDGKFSFTEMPRIANAIPYSIELSKLTISLLRPVVPASHILATMNGNIVALCGIDETGDTLETADNLYPKTLLRAPLSTCYGFGIVRGVDIDKGKIFLNTPLTVEELRYVNSFVSSIPLPTALIRDQDHRNAPYVGDGADLPTSRDPRRGYFRLRQRNS